MVHRGGLKDDDYAVLAAFRFALREFQAFGQTWVTGRRLARIDGEALHRRLS